METVYDWITVMIFGGMVVLFLHRSTQAEPPKDSLIQYLPPSIGCAVANYAGNHGQGLISFLIVVLVLGYIAYVLKPFGLKF